jgi:hypothetical protein
MQISRMRAGVPFKFLQERDLSRTQLRVPEIDDQHYLVTCWAIPCFVFKGVIK